MGEGRGPTMRRRATAFGLAVLAAVAIAAGCTAQPSYEGGSAVYGGPPPETSVWFAGDSVAYHTARHMPIEPYWRPAVGASGFTVSDEHLNGRILDNVLAQDPVTHQPDVVLAMGGTNDFSILMTPEQLIEAMDEFETTLADLGITTRWVLEPAWGHLPKFESVYEWQLSRPGAIDCTYYKGQSWDGIHPMNYTYLSLCINEAVHG